MPVKNVGQVKDRRSLPRAGVEHFEEGLKAAVEIDRGRRYALKHQFPVAVIPPPMRAADGKPRATTGLNLKVLAVQ